jgi:hypothetical protein
VCCAHICTHRWNQVLDGHYGCDTLYIPSVFILCITSLFKKTSYLLCYNSFPTIVIMCTVKPDIVVAIRYDEFVRPTCLLFILTNYFIICGWCIQMFTNISSIFLACQYNWFHSIFKVGLDRYLQNIVRPIYPDNRNVFIS